MGFGVSLHNIFAVGSPNLKLARAWAYSWKEIEIIKIIAIKRISNIIRENLLR